MSIWLHPEDLVQLCAIGLAHPDVHYEIVYGSSECEPSWWDNRRAAELGYRPKHRSADFRDAVMTSDPPPGPDDDSEVYQGGVFVLEP
jgi:uronate dehydrogenase